MVMKNRRHDDGQTWLQANWRAWMGWQYLVVCAFDFMIAPIGMAWFAYLTKTPLVQWTPLTVQGGGLYHIAMGAVVGVTSWAKTKEKLNSSQYVEEKPDDSATSQAK